MIENNNFPWYLQQSGVFDALYYGFFPVAEDASCLGIGDSFDINNAFGAQLFRLGGYWGLSGSPYVWNGMIYNTDKWSDGKIWSGSGTKKLSEEFYANLIRGKAYAYGRPFSLETIKGTLDRIFEGMEYSVKVYECGMIVDGFIDYGQVDEAAARSEDFGLVTDVASSTINYGEVMEVSEYPINKIVISLTASEAILRPFIEARGFDVTFIGHPVGINLEWEYNFI